MSSVSAARAASPSKDAVRPRVTRRTLLCKEGIVSVMIPESAQPGAYPSEKGLQRYVRFAHNVKRGNVNFFYHSPDASVCGTRVIAAAEIWRKELSDGRQYLHVDLRPTDETVPTHRISALGCKRDEIVFVEGLRAFQTPEPLVGVVVLAPVNALINRKPSVQT